MKKLVFVLFVAGTLTAAAQSRHEISLTLDNDVVFFTDRYYTAGHHLAYRRALGKDSTSRPILSVFLGNEIYTSKTIRFANPINLDRPYAGYLYAAVDFNHVWNKAAGIVNVEVGWVGEENGVGQMHQWWHEQTGYGEPRGWGNQIANEVIANVSYQYFYPFRLSDRAELISASSIYAGTGTNKINQQLVVRFLDFKSLNQSAYLNKTLASPTSDTDRESFMYASAGVDYVLSNIFLEGSLFESNESPFTVEASPWVFYLGLGYIYSKKKNTIRFELIGLTRETPEGFIHGYGRFAYARRF